MIDELPGPAGRERLLAGIAPENASEHHESLRRIFAAEIEYRRSDEDHEYFENLYWCAFLLYHVGDPSDVPLMWEAKHLNFDTATGFDVQFLVGAGVAATFRYLSEHGHADIVEQLAEYSELTEGRAEDLDRWAAFRRGYFCAAPSSEG